MYELNAERRKKQRQGKEDIGGGYMEKSQAGWVDLMQKVIQSGELRSANPG